MKGCLIKTKPEFAVMTFMFQPWLQDGRLTIEELLLGIADAGAGGVEPFHRDFVQDPGLISRYLKVMADSGLKVPAIDVISNLVYTNRSERAEGLDDLRRGLDICHQLGTDVAHVAGHRLLADVSPSDGRKMIAEGLMEVKDQACSAGITLGIENFNPSPTLICTASDCLEVMKLTDYTVRFVFDTGNFIQVKEDADSNFDLLADYICHCHFKEYTIDKDVPSGYRPNDLGQGDVPNAAIARKLMARGYDHWVALETCGRQDVSPINAVQRELPILKSWFDL